MKDDGEVASGSREIGTVEAEPTELVELVLADESRRRTGTPSRVDGVVIGVVTALDATGRPLVKIAAWDGEAMVARAMVSITPKDPGREVALLFEASDPQRPIVMGFMHEPPEPEAAEDSTVALERKDASPVQFENDGERIVFEAEKEIVLRCGKASITLTRAGKILIRGAYLLARSSGVNRIQGGSVQIN